MNNKKKTTHSNTTRPPIVTIMGHVDHGKTSILDYIRKTNVQEKEHGGITQHTGAYQLEHEGKLITFVDTPGHEAFSHMRARGGKVADIVILVVSAVEGVKPQTKEAIAHTKAAGVTLIVAYNKIDLPGADIEKVKKELLAENVLVEDWGGDVLGVGVSAKTGKGINELLEAILIVAELLDLKANVSSELEAVVTEAKLDRKRGSVVYAIVKNGTLKVGDEINASGYETKVKALFDDKGTNIKEASPSMPVEILGFKEIPNVGDLIVDKKSELVELAMSEDKIEILGLETKRTVNLILKADTQGTLEAVKASLANLITESAGADYSIKFLRCSTGDINDSDVLLASTADAHVVGFNVKIRSAVEDLSRDLNINTKAYKTVYEIIDEVSGLLEGSASRDAAKVKGRAQILELFDLPSGDVVLGCKVVAGALKPKQVIELYEKNIVDVTKDDLPVYTGTIKKVKHGKDDVQIAGQNTECGLLVKPAPSEVKTGFWIEVVG